jgi:hypothetical protein
VHRYSSPMESQSRYPIGRWVFAVVLIVVLIVVGSLVYWSADGRTGTPEDFRQRVADAGLSVEWSNSGPRGGSGTVDTSCGPVEVTIDEIDDQLWIRWSEYRDLVSAETVDLVLSCSR